MHCTFPVYSIRVGIEERRSVPADSTADNVGHAFNFEPSPLPLLFDTFSLSLDTLASGFVLCALLQASVRIVLTLDDSQRGKIPSLFYSRPLFFIQNR